MIDRLVGLSRRLLVLCLALVVGCSSVLFATGRANAEPWVASWYCQGFEGLTTASGETYDCDDYTAAHKTLPFGTKLIVTYNGRSVVVRINDRGPYIAGRDLDLSGAAAEYIGLTSVGVATVDVEYADPSTPEGPYNAETQAQPTAKPTATPTVEPTAEPTAEPTVEPTAEPTAKPTAETQSAAAGEYQKQASAEKARAATEGQYSEEPTNAGAAEQQYGNAAEEQYSEQPPRAQPTQPSTQPAPQPTPQPPSAQTTPQPAAQAQSEVEVQPPAPAPGSLEQPPPDLIQPGTTVEKRVILLLAAPPKGFENLPDPVQASKQSTTPTSSTQPPKPATQPSEEHSGSDGALLTVLPDTGGAPLVALVFGGALIAGGLVFRRVFR